MKWSGTQLGEKFECQDYRDEQLLVVPAFVDPDDRGRYIWISDITSSDYGLWHGDGVVGAWVKAGGGTIRTVTRPWINGTEGELRRDAATGIIFIWNSTAVAWTAILSTEKNFTIYVDPVAGSDTDTGAGPGNPVEHVQEVYRRLPPTIAHTVTVDLVGGLAGTPLTYDEYFRFDNFLFKQGGEIIVRGKSALASLPTGPNQAVATGGTINTVVVAGAGWTVGAMVGLRVFWTGGAQAAVAPYSFIVANTATTLFLSAMSVAGAYAPGDAFDVEEITTIWQNTASGDPATLELYNLFGARLADTADAWIRFDDLHFVGDPIANMNLIFAGIVSAEFLSCRIDDIVDGSGSGVGRITFDQCGIFLTINGAVTPWFSSAPDWAGAVVFQYTGGHLAYLQESTEHRSFLLTYCAIYGDGVLTELLTHRSGYLYLADTLLHGFAGTAVPIFCDRGPGGRIYIQDSILEESPTSGIEVPQYGLSQVQIEMDPAAGASDLRNNTTFGIDMSAPGTILFRHATTSSIANGTAGVRLRNGGIASYYGIPGNIPTMIGPAPNTEIEFDNNVGGPYMLFGGPTGTGLQTLCRYIYDGGGPP